MPKISQLAELLTLKTGSIIPVVDGLVTKKVTMGTLVGFLNVETGVIPSGTVSSSGQLNDLGAVTTSSLNSLSGSISSTTYRISGSSLSTSSFNIYTSSNDAKVNSLINNTGSFATTGSNQFNGTQSITGSLTVSGGINFSTSSHIKFVNDGFAYSANNDIEIKAGNIRISSSMNNPNTGLHISGNTFITGFIQIGTIYGNWNSYIQNYGNLNVYGTSNLYGELYSPSLGKYLQTSSFEIYTGSASINVSGAINSATQSLSSSIALINSTQLSTSSFNSYTSSIPSISSGSWIPNFVSGNLYLSGTLSSSYGYYQKIGNIVNFTLTATLITNGSSGDGTIKFYPPLLPSYNFNEAGPVLGRYDEVIGTATVYSINTGGAEAYIYTDTTGSKLITLYATDGVTPFNNTVRISVSAQYKL
jgi:hypothetical protein